MYILLLYSHLLTWTWLEELIQYRKVQKVNTFAKQVTLQTRPQGGAPSVSQQVWTNA